MEAPKQAVSSFAEPFQQHGSGSPHVPPDGLHEPVATDPAADASGGWRIQGNPVGDTSTATDKLGFAPYVEAVAAFLVHPDTRPPLTLSIEGEWGMGKSSFMRQLQAELDPETRKPAPGIVHRARRYLGLVKPSPRLTFWFNAWRHDTRDAMWATFALSITRNLRKSQSLPGRIGGDIRLAASRVEGLTGWLQIAFAAVLIFAIAIGAAIVAAYPFNVSAEKRGEIARKALTIVLPSDEKKSVQPNAAAAKPPAGNTGKTSFFTEMVATRSTANPLFEALFLLLAFGYWVRKSAGKSLEFKLERYLSTPDYKSRVSFVETFHEDFQRVVRAYAGDRKVFIFVDDLDRTDVPKAAELMQAINLMIGDDPRLVFILGIDREKVAAGIALKFKEIQPLLERVREGEVSARHPAAFGYLFLEKFIQITFRVPRPSESGIKEFLDSLANKRDEMRLEETRKEAEREQRKEQRRHVDVRSRADSEEVQTLIRLVAPALQWNPRRMKQFINDFRLQAYIASDLRMLDLVSTDDGPERASVTLEQLGKFVAITMAWPDLVMDFVEFPELLCSIYAAERFGVESFLKRSVEVEISLAGKEYVIPLNADRRELIQRWSAERTLVSLLKAVVEGKDKARYSLEHVDVRVLLNISPKVQSAKAQRAAAQGAVASGTNANAPANARSEVPASSAASGFASPGEALENEGEHDDRDDGDEEEIASVASAKDTVVSAPRTFEKQAVRRAAARGAAKKK